MKVEVYYIVKTYSNGLSKIESGPYYSLMDVLDAKERIWPPYEKDYMIAKTELEMELV